MTIYVIIHLYSINNLLYVTVCSLIPQEDAGIEHISIHRKTLLLRTRCENGAFHVGMPVGQVLATLALAAGLCIGRFSWRKIRVLLILAPLSLSIYLYLCGAE